MHLFKRGGRKESNGPSSSSNGSPSKHSGSKILSTTLPSSSSSSSLKHASYHGGLPPVPEKITSTLRPAQQQHHASSPAMYISERSNGGQTALDEFGALPQYSGRSARPAFLKDTHATSSSSNSYLKPLPAPKNGKGIRRMSTGSIPSLDGLLKEATGDAEMQLCYGYWPIETQRELSLVEIEEVVRMCGQEIKTRGIEAPMLFSTQALDISLENITSLIRSYVSDRNTWKRDLRLANPHDLAGMIKWALGRYINPQGGRGFLAWETYERWRFAEREKEFPTRHLTTNLLYQLPTQNAALLTSLLSLLCSALAYTTKNGCTPRKLATLFSSYIFGLPDDGTFEHTYTAFNRFSHATEHLLLAYVRNETSSHVPGSGAPSTVPVRLQELVTDYPKCLPINLNKPPSGVDLQQVVRVRRLARFYSRNLVQSAGTWEVPRSQNWALAAPFPQLKSSETASQPNMDEDQSSNFLYTSKYRHLLAIRSVTGVAQEMDDEIHKYGSSVQKEWMSFMDNGFAPPDQNKLRFDLTESDRQARRKKHETIDWSSFESSGFAGRETFLDTDLSFVVGANDLNKQDDLLSEQHRKLIAAKAKAFEKTLPPFTWDIQPREERSIQVDKQFFEVFSDVLCSSGWTRDEVKESNWALVQYKTRPKDLERSPSPGKEARTTETWFLVEEIVPAEYRAALLATVGQSKAKTSRRVSFLRAVRLRPSKPPPVPIRESPPPPVSSLQFSNSSERSLPRTPQRMGKAVATARSSSPALKYPDDALFTPGSGGPPTKVVTLSKSFSSAGMSTASSKNDEDREVLNGQQPVPPVPAMPDQLPRESIDSRAEGSIASTKGGGLGYTKPSSAEKTGNKFVKMIRKTTRRGSANPVMDTAFNRSRLDIDSPEAVGTPGSSTSVGFNVEEHGVSGSGQTVHSPSGWMDAMAKQQQTPPALSAQRYQRASPSFSGTARTVDSAATAGHGSDSTARLPVPSTDESHRLTTASALQADAIVDSYGNSDNPLRVSVVSSQNAYDGLAEDDDETVQDGETLVIPSGAGSEEKSPSGDTIWRGSQYEDQQGGKSILPKRSSSLSDNGLRKSDSGVGMLSPERPRLYFKGHPSQEAMPNDHHLQSPTSPETAAPLPPSKV